MLVRSLIPPRFRARRAPQGCPGAVGGGEACPGEASVWAAPPMRLVIAVGVLLIALIVVAVMMLLSNLRSEEIAKNKRDLDSLALVLAGQIDRSFQSIGIIQDGLIDRMHSRGIASTADLKREMSGYGTYRHLKDQISALPFIDAIVLTDRNGKLINFSRRWPVPPIQNKNNDHDRIFRTTARTFYVGTARRSPANGAWILSLARKIEGPHGAFLGTVLGVIRLDYFQHLFQSVARANDRAISLFTDTGKLVARFPPDNALLGTSFADRPVYRRVLARAGAGTVAQTDPARGPALLIAGRKLPHYPLAVVISKRRDDALAGWRYAALYVAGAALVIALLIGAATFIVARQIARNFRAQNHRLDAALNNMSQGLSMFDASARLIVWNERYIEMFKLQRDKVTRGAPLQDLIRIRFANGTFDKGGVGDPDRYVRNIQANAKQGKPQSTVHELNDGRTIAVVNHPLPGGGWVATHEDITEARRRENSFRFLFESNPVPMWVYDLESLRILAVNGAAIAHYGYTREQFLAMTVLDIRPADQRVELLQFLHETGGYHVGEHVARHQKADGSLIDVGVYARPMNYQGHQSFVVAVHDITDRKRAEEQLRRTEKFLDTIIENVPVPILVKDVTDGDVDTRDYRYSLVNRAFEAFFGISRQQVIGRTVREFYPKEHAAFILAANHRALGAPHPVVESDHTIRTPANGIRIASATSVAVRDDNEQPRYLVTVLQDVTERKHTEQRIARIAHYDNLTDLPNRVTFNDALAAALERAAQSGESFAVLSVDLDGFKDANDTYGHMIGDALLSEIARRLQAAAGETFVARIGGDEFALIVTGVGPPEAATAMGERVLKALCEDVDLDGISVPISATIGGAIYPQHGGDAKTLLINADVALYRAKATARGTLLFFDAEMGERLRERRALQEDLRLAVARGALTLHYQPQQKMSGEVVGFEALVRWESPGRGEVPPDVFIPVAEETGLIGAIDEWVLRAACREAVGWQRPFTVAVNISALQFRLDDLPRRVHAILLETGLSAGRLELEITEGVLIDDFSRAMAVLAQLKALGVRIALDDFGTGYSSLSYLHAFSFDKIKIDRAFIGDLERNQHSIAIVRAVIDLGHSLNVPILAEGVETAEQHALLFRKGCDEVQGYFTGRPLPIADYADLVAGEPAPSVRRARAG